jgi:pimeloyl-ACP methyl ester carboxylesterase
MPTLGRRHVDPDRGCSIAVQLGVGRLKSARRLSGYRCPTLVLVGDGDALTPPALSQELAGGIAGSRLVVVPDCGHLSTMERPEAVTRALAEWMAG